MTNKINSLLAIFMALFVFSCASDPITPIVIPIPSVGDEDGYDTFFSEQRVDITDAAFDAQWKNNPEANPPTAKQLTGKYIITELGASGEYISLYIKPITTAPANHNAALGPNYDLNYAKSDTVAKARALSEDKKYWDPRKLLTDKGGRGVRIAWSGRVADPPDVVTGNYRPLGSYKGYDNYKSAAGSGGGGGYGLNASWTAYDYAPKDQNPSTRRPMNNRIWVYVKATKNGTTRAWFWMVDKAMNDHVVVEEHYSFVAPNDNLGFGYGSKLEDKDKEPRYNSTPDMIWSKGLHSNTETGNATGENNVNPPGKMIFARKTGGKGIPLYQTKSAVFLTTVVGYNIRTKDVSADDLKLLDLPSGTTAEEFYMEFDAASYEDAKADEYTEMENFPHWGDLDGEGDGFSIDGKGAKVIKFTGILLKR